MPFLAGLVNLIHTLTCQHPSTSIHYGEWRNDPDVGETRVKTKRCDSCDAVLDIRSELKGAPWL